jgi:Tol biopolymer transport system component
MGPAWSPDGSRIAFMTYSDSGTADIHLINADGTNRVGVTNDSQFDWQPAWSPDGSRIAFVRDADVFTMNADGTNLVRLTTHRLAAFPSWSPDGLYIAYTLMSECDWPERCAGATLWTIRLADGHQSPLPTVQENALFPSWRP